MPAAALSIVGVFLAFGFWWMLFNVCLSIGLIFYRPSVDQSENQFGSTQSLQCLNGVGLTSRLLVDPPQTYILSSNCYVNL